MNKINKKTRNKLALYPELVPCQQIPSFQMFVWYRLGDMQIKPLQHQLRAILIKSQNQDWTVLASIRKMTEDIDTVYIIK